LPACIYNYWPIINITKLEYICKAHDFWSEIYNCIQSKKIIPLFVYLYIPCILLHKLSHVLITHSVSFFNWPGKARQNLVHFSFNLIFNQIQPNFNQLFLSRWEMHSKNFVWMCLVFLELSCSQTNTHTHIHTHIQTQMIT
jgi:hypothetical protein